MRKLFITSIILDVNQKNVETILGFPFILAQFSFDTILNEFDEAQDE